LKFRGSGRLLLAFLVFTLVGGLGTAAYFERTSVPGAAAIAIFGGVTIVVASQLLTTLAEGGTVSFESSWGGLGGARGGWRMSAPLGYLAALLVSGLLLAGAVAVEMDRTVDTSPASSTDEEADSPALDGADEDAGV
jgi:hypothetical protein